MADTVSHKNVAGRVPCDIGRPIKDVTLSACPRKSSAAGSTALATGAGTAVAARSRNGNRLGFSTQQELGMSRRIELHNEVRHLIDDPDVVLRVDTDLLGEDEAVAVLSYLPNEFAVSIELE